MNLFHSFFILAGTIVPLVVLTAMAFFGGGVTADVTGYEPADLAIFVELQTTTKNIIATLPPAQVAIADDPTGFSVDGEPSDSLALVYEVAKQLSRAEQAIKSIDTDLIQLTKRSFQSFVVNQMAAIENLRPHGDALASSIKHRTKQIDAHELWLSKREVFRETFINAELAIADGPEIKGEEKCLELLRQLEKDFPTPADPITTKDEAVDALTPEEAERLTKLKKRAMFRGKYFTLQQATTARSENTTELKSQLDAWDSFLKRYAKNGAPDSRDNMFFEDSKKLRQTAELNWRWALALNQSTVGELLTAVSDWLRIAKSEKGDDKQHQHAAAILVQSWLEKKIPPVPKKPKGIEGRMEGFTDPGNKRKIGFFKKVLLTEKQYHYWINKAMIQIKPKGEFQFNLQSPPTEPEYGIILADYSRCRKTFLTDGYQTEIGGLQFRDECSRLGEKYYTHRTKYEEPDNSIDLDASAWGVALESAEKIAAELVSEGNKSQIWKFLKTKPNP